MEFHEKSIPVLVLLHLLDLPDETAGKVIKAFLDHLEYGEYDMNLDAETFAFVKIMSIAYNEIETHTIRF